MNHNPSPSSRPRHWRRWIPPVAAVGTGVTALVIWLEEVIALVTEFIGVIILPILAGVIYLFNVYIFKSAMPKSDDMKK